MSLLAALEHWGGPALLPSKGSTNRQLGSAVVAAQNGAVEPKFGCPSTKMESLEKTGPLRRSDGAKYTGVQLPLLLYPVAHQYWQLDGTPADSKLVHQTLSRKPLAGTNLAMVE